jgi:hypothetical protein
VDELRDGLLRAKLRRTEQFAPSNEGKSAMGRESAAASIVAKCHKQNQFLLSRNSAPRRSLSTSSLALFLCALFRAVS